MHFTKRFVCKDDGLVLDHKISVKYLFNQGSILELRFLQLRGPDPHLLFQPSIVLQYLPLMHTLEVIAEPMDGIGQTVVDLGHLSTKLISGGLLSQQGNNDDPVQLKGFLNIGQQEPGLQPHLGDVLDKAVDILVIVPDDDPIVGFKGICTGLEELFTGPAVMIHLLKLVDPFLDDHIPMPMVKFIYTKAHVYHLKSFYIYHMTILYLF